MSNTQKTDTTTQQQTAPNTGQQPLSWERLGKFTKEEYEARREEIQRWMSCRVKAGKVVD